MDVPAGPASKGEDHFSDEFDMNLNDLVCLFVDDGSAFPSTLHGLYVNSLRQSNWGIANFQGLGFVAGFFALVPDQLAEAVHYCHRC